MAGNLELVGSYTASGTTAVYYAEFNNIFSDEYDDYKLILSGGRTGSGNPNNLEMRMMDSAGGKDGGTVYTYGIQEASDNSSTINEYRGSANAVYRTVRLSTNSYGNSFEMDVYGPYIAQFTQINFSSIYWHQTSNLMQVRKGVVCHERMGSYTGVAFLVESSPNFVNVLDVRLDVYGYKKE